MGRATEFSYVNGTLTINNKFDQTITFPVLGSQEQGLTITWPQLLPPLPITYSIVTTKAAPRLLSAMSTPTKSPSTPSTPPSALSKRGRYLQSRYPRQPDLQSPGAHGQPHDWTVAWTGRPIFSSKKYLHSAVRDGDTINIAAGTHIHQEELGVNKRLLLQSDGSGKPSSNGEANPSVSKSTNPVWHNTPITAIPSGHC